MIVVDNPLKRVLILIVTYNAEKFISGVIRRIPGDVWQNSLYTSDALVIDDQSQDATFEIAEMEKKQLGDLPITVLHNPCNQGYGGNQKIGYHYAIRNRFDAVVLLHGDGQYPPEMIDEMVRPILNGEADCVLGSRMAKKSDALRGGMPLYKWIGNQILTFTENLILHANLSEYHTGFRAYSTRALAQVPFAYDSDYFDFDTDILIQMLDTKARFREIAIPTTYGEMISRVNGFRYGALIIRSCLVSRISRMGILYHPKFDYETGETNYQSKIAFPSSHRFALERVNKSDVVLDIGCGPAILTASLVEKRAKIYSLDLHIHPQVKDLSESVFEEDLDLFDFSRIPAKIDTILALDIIEHTRSPEEFLRKIRFRFARDKTRIILTTGNIAFFPIRLQLLFGKFNYGRRGILDHDHKRLFTFGSLKQMARDLGFDILEVKGIPAPFPLAIGEGKFSRLLVDLNRLAIRVFKGLFAYQIALVIQPRPVLDDLLQNAVDSAETRREKMNRLEEAGIGKN